MGLVKENDMSFYRSEAFVFKENRELTNVEAKVIRIIPSLYGLLNKDGKQRPGEH